MIKKLAIIFLSLFYASPAFAQCGVCTDGRLAGGLCTAYVGPAGAGECGGGYNGGDCDFNSLSAAEANLQCNLSSGGGYSVEIKLYNLGPSTPDLKANFSGWTTASGFQIILRGIRGATPGVYSTDAWRIEDAGLASTYGVIYMSEDYATFDGLQIKTVWNNANHYSGIGNATVHSAGLHIYTDNIFWGHGTGGALKYGCIATEDNSVVYQIMNNICYETGTDTYANWAGLDLTQSAVGSYAYNNTVKGDWSWGSSRCESNMICANNIFEVDLDCYNSSASGTHDNNMCNGNYTPFAGSNNLTETTATFVGVGTDYHLQSGSNGIDAGKDLSGTFTEDIDGDDRTAGTWDIGADEVAGAAPGPAGYPNYIMPFGMQDLWDRRGL